MRLPDSSKPAAQKALESLASLTYQQKQLMTDGEYSAVLHHILSKRRITNKVIAALALIFGYLAVRSIVSGSFPWIHFCVCAGFSVWVYSRMSKERAAVRSVPMDTDAGSTNTPVSDLAIELRLNYSLSYDQLQLLKQGKVNEAATAVAAVRRENGLKLLFWMLPVGVALIFVAILRFRQANTIPVLLLADLLIIAIFCLLMVAGAIRELRIASLLTEKINAATPRFE